MTAFENRPELLLENPENDQDVIKNTIQYNTYFDIFIHIVSIRHYLGQLLDS
jgi:hypothetical protein